MQTMTTSKSGKGYSMASRSASSNGYTKSWLMRNITSMITAVLVGLLLLGISFEAKLHRHTQIKHADRKALHTKSALRDSASTHLKREAAKHKKAKAFNWKPIESETCALGLSLDPFPALFEPKLYKEINGKGKDYHHYIEIGRKEGLECTRGQRMKEIFNVEILPHFLKTIPHGKVLEIGPFLNPMLLDSEVQYFDVLDLEGLKERGRNVGYPEINPVEIDYVNPNGDLSVIPLKGEFSLVASSNVLSNQIDLVHHLKQVEDLLQEGGYYALTLSDKRYTFDHHLPETTIAEVLDDFYNKRGESGFHSMRSVIEHRDMTVHNDIQLHWSGNHGAPYSDAIVEKIQQAMNEYKVHKQEGKYLDVHNYKFTPQGLAFIVDVLHNLKLTNLRVHRLYETVSGRFEFGIVLKKCTPGRESADVSMKMA